MIKSAVSKMMWVGRTTVFLIGLAVILALVFGAASMAFAGNGDPWRLGQNNVATAITVLGGAAGVDGPMVRLTNNNGGTDDTALELGVQSGEPPMKVNSSTKVANLNADQLDGKDSRDFFPAGGALPSGTTLRGNYEIDGDADEDVSPTLGTHSVDLSLALARRAADIAAGPPRDGQPPGSGVGPIFRLQQRPACGATNS